MYEAVILAGGRGQRLRPYTDRLPKPLLPLGSLRLIDYVLLNLRKAGVKTAIITTGFLHEKIINYLGNEKFGIQLEYNVEEQPLGTAGSILPIKDKLAENFLVVMGDHLTNINLRALLNYHLKKGNIATIAVKELMNVIEYGVVDTNDGVIKEFKEKPLFKNYINTGIYAFNRRIFEFFDEEIKDFAKDLFPKLIREGQKISAFVTTDFWVDVGRVKDYEYYRDMLEVIEFYFDLFGKVL